MGESKIRQKNKLEKEIKKIRTGEKTVIGEDGKEYIVKDDKLEQQLTDIWNKAQEGKADPLIEEAKKYKTADEFVKAQGKIEDSHVAPGGKGESLKERLDYEGDVTLREELFGHHKQPADFFHGYTGPKLNPTFYGPETINAIRKANKTGEITMYRAVPKNIDKISDGEWVYFVKEQAKEHGANRLNGNYKILEQKASIDDVWWDGNDIREWGFDSGKSPIKTTTHSKSQLTDIWNKAQEGKTDPLIEEAKKYKTAEEFVEKNILYHGTSEGAARAIQREGALKTGQAIGSDKTGYGKQLFFADTEQHALSYAQRKSTNHYLLRTKKTNEFIPDTNVVSEGDFKIEKNIPINNIEIKMPNGEWTPISNYDFYDKKAIIMNRIKTIKKEK